VTSLVGTMISFEAVSSNDETKSATLEFSRIRVPNWVEAITAGNALFWSQMGGYPGAPTMQSSQLHRKDEE